MIQLNSVVRHFGRVRALDGVTLHVAPGESVALWGANGAGKTTLLRCVLGLIRFRGSIRIGPHDVRRAGKQARMLVGYVPQEIGFYDDARVDESVRFFARLRGIPLRDGDRVLGSVGLEGHGRKRMRELSGGMKQRLALAIALLGDPSVLLLDEVTASLDALGRREFMEMLRDLAGEGRTLLFASHRLDEISALAGRVVVLESGRVQEIVPARQLARTAGNRAILHMHMEPGQCEDARRHLRHVGFEARLNGTGVIVPVAEDRKAVPFRVLAEAAIRVDDFECLGSEVDRDVIGTHPRCDEGDRP